MPFSYLHLYAQFSNIYSNRWRLILIFQILKIRKKRRDKMMRRIVLYSLFLSVICFMLAGRASASTGFGGIYDPSNWTLTLTNSDGGIDTAGAPGSIEISSGDNGTLYPGHTDYEITAPLAGVVSFDWTYHSTNAAPGWDPFGYLINGGFTQLTDDYGPVDQSGSGSFSVAPNDYFGFRASTYDNVAGRATTTISNFTAPVPIPTTLLLFGSGLVFVKAMKRKVKR
jgi:hypothetical protein